MANARLIYPLEQVLEIKRKRVKDAERALQEAKQELARQEEILKQKEKERDIVLKHRNEKLAQIRAEMDLVGETTTSQKILQMKDYLKVVAKKLLEEEKKVEEQKGKVREAEEKVRAAKEHLRLKILEVDKLEIHKKDWLAEVKTELQLEEDRELDEIGSIIYQGRQRQEK
jgi:hypothetical protein